eukprot:2449702-Prymnesium_polylepis.1
MSGRRLDHVWPGLKSSERPHASHAYPLSTCYSGNASHRSVCPRTRVPVARFRLVPYVQYVKRAVHTTIPRDLRATRT